MYEHSSDDTSIKDIIKSLEAEFGVKFEQASKVVVRNRLKELLTLESTKNEDDVSCTVVSGAAKPSTAQQASETKESGDQDSLETLSSGTRCPETGSPPNTTKQGSSTCNRIEDLDFSSMASSSSGSAAKASKRSPPDSLTPRRSASPARVSKLNKSREQSLKQSSSRHITEKVDGERPTSSLFAGKSSGSERPSLPPEAQVTSSIASRTDSPYAKPSAQKEKKGSGSRPSEVEKEQEPYSLLRMKRTRPMLARSNSTSTSRVASLPGNVDSPSTKPSSRTDKKDSGSRSQEEEKEPMPEVIDLLSDTDDAGDEEVVEILSD
jgi:hypothetical protein